MHSELYLFLVEDERAYFVDQNPAYFRFEHDESKARPWFGKGTMPKPWREFCRASIVKVYFEAPNHTVCEPDIRRAGKGEAAWMLPTDWTKTQHVILSGMTLQEFVSAIRESGGEVYSRYWKEAE